MHPRKTTPSTRKRHSGMVALAPVVLTTLALGLSGCAGSPSHSGLERGPGTRPANPSLASQESAPRTPAQDRQRSLVQVQTRANLSQLRTVRPGKFRVLVYPKISTNKFKTNDPAMAEIGDRQRLDMGEQQPRDQWPLLGRPEEFEVSPIVVNPCAEFFRSSSRSGSTREDRGGAGFFGKYRPAEVFAPSLAQSSQTCAIVEVTSVRLRDLNRELIRRGDLRAVRVYLDDAYRVHGYERDVFADGQNITTVRVQNDPSSGGSSNLTLFPLLFPADDVLYSQGGNAKVRVAGPISLKLDRLSITQASRAMRDFRVAPCSATAFFFEDYFGGTSKTVWCDGSPWPLAMENDKMIAVTQPISGGAQ